jgi:C4-dicarboxylate transporter DctQ subunit
VRLTIDLAGLVFSLYIAKLALDITFFVLRSGQSSPTLDVSMAWLYAAMPVGFVLLALRYVLRAVG